MGSESSKFSSVECTQTQVYTAELKQARSLLHVRVIDLLGTSYLNFKHIENLFQLTFALHWFSSTPKKLEQHRVPNKCRGLDSVK